MSAQAVGSAERPTYDLRLVQAARRSGVRHVVKLSVYSGSTGNDVLAAWHGEAEATVIDSGIDWPLLRPGRFMSNALQWVPMLRAAARYTLRSRPGRPRRSIQPTSPRWPWSRSPPTSTATSAELPSARCM